MLTLDFLSHHMSNDFLLKAQCTFISLLESASVSRSRRMYLTCHIVVYSTISPQCRPLAYYMLDLSVWKIQNKQ